MNLLDRTRRLIRADGTEEVLPAPLRDGDMAKLIGATTCDNVNLRHMGRPLMVMMLDDNGWNYDLIETTTPEGRVNIEHRVTTPRLPINEKATALYRANCIPGTTHQIAGDVIVMPDDDFMGPGRSAS